MDGFQLSQDYRTTMRRKFIFYHKVSRSSWDSFDQPWMMKSWVDLALQPSNLLHKLKFDGISGRICNLISSLLNHTHLRMVLDGKSLQGYLGNAGVSQSSILGPSHFRYALLTFLVMLSLILLSMSLMILLCTLSVSKHIIYGNI